MNKDILDAVIADTGFKKEVIKKAVNDYGRILRQEINDIDLYDPYSFKVLTWPRLFTLVPTIKNYVKYQHKYKSIKTFNEVCIEKMHKMLKEYIPIISKITKENSKRFRDRDNIFDRHSSKIKNNKQ